MKRNGLINKQYAEIADSFKENFENHGEIGASLCVYHEHEMPMRKVLTQGDDYIGHSI